MDDRELLKLAAKAAGVVGNYQKYIDSGLNCGIVVYGDKKASYWNPLTDDGDALRLAVKLGIDIELQGEGVWANGLEVQFYQRFERHKGDPYAATRRAIVRAAAEIGKNPPQNPPSE